MNETSARQREAEPVEVEALEFERLPARVWQLGALMVVIGIVTFVLMSTQVGNGGYLYLLFYSIPSNTAISIFPHEPVLIYYGTFANIWLSAAAATGGTIIAGYLDHRVFVPVLNYKKIVSYKASPFYKKGRQIFMRYPFLTLVITGLSPIPFFPFKFLCFSIGYPLVRYLAALSLARYPRYAALAWVGLAFKIPNWLLIAAVVIVFALYAVRGGPMVWRRLRARSAARREPDTPPPPSEGDAVRQGGD